MHSVKIKPLSVNEAWRGRRFKTPKYKQYQQALNILLPKIILPAAPYSIIYHVYYSSRASDIDNFLKQFNDCLQKKYYFDDKHIYHIEVFKHVVKKGQEKIEFNIMHYDL